MKYLPLVILCLAFNFSEAQIEDANPIDTLNSNSELVEFSTPAQLESKEKEIRIKTIEPRRVIYASSIKLDSNFVSVPDYFWERKINVNNINTITCREKGSTGKGMLRGALFGFAIGGAIGLMSGNEELEIGKYKGTILSGKQKALYFGIGAGLTGAIIGAIVEGVIVKIPINGNPDLYHNQKEHLNKLIY